MQENEEAGYGFSDDEEQIGQSSAFIFGLNQNVTKMVKFEHITNGGKGGAEGEALDIVFNINGQDKGYRMFPVTKAFGKNNQEITDPKSEEMKAEFTRFNSIMAHILGCFVEKEAVKVAFSVPFPNGPDRFKHYCSIAKGLLPANFATISLDIFLEYQWQITGENKRTFLQIPKKMKSGIWLGKAVQPFNADGTTGEWKEVRKSDPSANDPQALYYTDGKGNIHPFIRNGWYANSAFANQQIEDSSDNSGINQNPGNDATTDANVNNTAAPSSGW